MMEQEEMVLVADATALAVISDIVRLRDTGICSADSVAAAHDLYGDVVVTLACVMSFILFGMLIDGYAGVLLDMEVDEDSMFPEYVDQGLRIMAEEGGVGLIAFVAEADQMYAEALIHMIKHVSVDYEEQMAVPSAEQLTARWN